MKAKFPKEQYETLDSKLTRTPILLLLLLLLLLFFDREKVYAKDDRIIPFEKAVSLRR